MENASPKLLATPPTKLRVNESIRRMAASTPEKAPIDPDNYFNIFMENYEKIVTEKLFRKISTEINKAKENLSSD